MRLGGKSVVLVHCQSSPAIDVFLSPPPLPAHMASKLKRGAYALVGLLAVGSVVHYVKFGSLPLGKPELLRDDPDPTEIEV